MHYDKGHKAKDTTTKQKEEYNEISKLTHEIKRIEKKRAKEKGKILGTCDCCSSDTVLVEETGMCGPCTFGEADTLNGNW